MRKSYLKVKKVLFSILLVITSFPSKIFATTFAPNPYDIKEGMQVDTRSIVPGVSRKPVVELLIIPIAVLIGLIVYFKKSKSSKKKKIAVIGLIAVTVIWCIAIIIYKFYLNVLYA